MEFAGAVIIEDLGKDARMSIEKIFIEYRIVVGQSLGQARQSCGRDFFQRRAVRLETETAHVQDNAILAVHGFERPVANTNPVSFYTQRCQ